MVKKKSNSQENNTLNSKINQIPVNLKGKSEKYLQVWNIFYPDVTARPNFKQGHLLQLDIMCNLYLELDHLNELIKDEGYTYSSEGRYGLRVALNPNIQQRLKVQAEIRAYSKLLGITLHKDVENADQDAQDEWA